MNRPEFRIPEDRTQDVFTRAAQLYAQHNQSYSVKELMEAGAEAKIPPEFIQQAIEELQITQTQQAVPTARTKRSKLFIGFAIGLPLLAAIAAAAWLLARNAATNAEAPPVQTVQPIANQPPLSNTSPVTGSFKCGPINFAGKDLSDKNLSGADCHRGKLPNTNLSNTILQSSNLSYADLRNANLRGADLRGANLTEANLAGADLSGAQLRGANLSKTDLTGANLKNTNIGEADTAEAIMDGAKQ
ncbi:MAG: pentapeptide repeat-containing protein [Cyanobacteriota bacterium]